MNNLGIQNLDKFIVMVFNNVLRFAKSGDTLFSEKIKFILREEENKEMPINAICNINIISANKPKNVESVPGGKKGGKKGASKAVYEFDYYEKCPSLPFFSENNCKIICYSLTFEKMMRYNILDCINKAFKIDDLDKEAFMNKLEENYNDKFINPFINELAEKFNKDIITYDIDLTADDQK